MRNLERGMSATFLEYLQRERWKFAIWREESRYC